MSRFVMQVAAQAQTIAELTKERDGYLHQLQNDEGYAELTAKLDAVRRVAEKWHKYGPDKRTLNLEDGCADELLAILDAPTKPKEARNE